MPRMDKFCRNGTFLEGSNRSFVFTYSDIVFMKIEVPHQHTKEQAQQRIKDLLQGLREKYSDKISSIEENWEGNTNAFKLGVGPFSTSGSIEVKDKQVDIDISIPLFAGMYKNQIKALIEEQAKKVLG